MRVPSLLQSHFREESQERREIEALVPQTAEQFAHGDVRPLELGFALYYGGAVLANFGGGADFGLRHGSLSFHAERLISSDTSFMWGRSTSVIFSTLEIIQRRISFKSSSESLMVPSRSTEI